MYREVSVERDRQADHRAEGARTVRAGKPEGREGYLGESSERLSRHCLLNREGSAVEMSCWVL